MLDAQSLNYHVDDMAKRSDVNNRTEYHSIYYRKVLKAKREARVKETRTGKCGYCGANGIIIKDHKISLADGGDHEQPNLFDCCQPCNYSKGKLPLETWRKTIARWYIGAPYFSPEQIAYILKHGLDLLAIIEVAATNIQFFFEGGSGGNIQQFVSRRVDRRAARTV